MLLHERVEEILQSLSYLLLKSLKYADTGDVLKALLQLLNLDHIVLHLKKTNVKNIEFNLTTCLHRLLADSLCSPVKSFHILVVQLHCNVAVRDHRVKVVQLVVGSSSGFCLCFKMLNVRKIF